MTTTTSVFEIKEIKVLANAKASRWSTAPRTTKVRVYFFIDGEDVIANLAARMVPETMSARAREYRKLLPEVLRRVAGAGMDAGNLEGVNASWNRKAGCSCGCSPGFVLDTIAQKSIYVTVTVAA